MKNPHSEKIKRAALETIQLEIAGLQKLSQAIDDNFVQAVLKLSAISGRVIISGMGKSGHIAHKIVATMASTGTAALFVHPAEAAHGDLGMIDKNDALIMLSWSGETSELYPLITHARRFDILLIALTSSPQSTLARQADITITLPNVDEAGELNLAPTSSTTIQLALGDALCVALWEKKGFNKDHFRTLHPGGNLGSKLKKLSELMHSGDNIPLCLEDEKMSKVLLTISQKAFGCVGVVNHKGDIIGIITDGDLRRHMSNHLLDKRAKDVMSAHPQIIAQDEMASTALCA